MSRDGSSIARRVASSAMLAACGAALLGAAVTSGLAMVLVQRSEDRRIENAAAVLGRELQAEVSATHSAADVLRAEVDEMQDTGLSFAIFSNNAAPLGDARLSRGEGCRTVGDARLCGVDVGGYYVVAAAAHVSLLPPFGIAALAALGLAAVFSFLGSRAAARWSTEPLSRLRSRVAQLPAGNTALGDAQQVLEVDELQRTIEALLQRVNAALEQATRFAANAAHELRTPLTSIRAELELAAEGHGDLPRARRQVETLQTLLERILVLALPSAASAEGFAPVSLREVVEDALVDGATLEPGDVDAVVQGDAALLTLLVNNALSNAIKYGQRATVRVLRRDAAAVLQVDDEGPGVPEAERTRVFEPFHRAASARAARIEGHGLGLALIAHVAQLHRGQAQFVDGARGARLEVTFPDR